MKKGYFFAVITTIVFTACAQKEKAISQSEIQAKVDSIVGTKIGEINRQAMEDLDRRMTIEVKAKADSIVAAAAPADNTVTGPQTTP